MNIYIGRWDKLPDEWDDCEMHGLDGKKEIDILHEIQRQRALYPKGRGDNSYTEHELINVYTPEQFEATFNNDLYGLLNTSEYFIKIF